MGYLAIVAALPCCATAVQAGTQDDPEILDAEGDTRIEGQLQIAQSDLSAAIDLLRVFFSPGDNQSLTIAAQTKSLAGLRDSAIPYTGAAITIFFRSSRQDYQFGAGAQYSGSWRFQMQVLGPDENKNVEIDGEANWEESLVVLQIPAEVVAAEIQSRVVDNFSAFANVNYGPNPPSESDSAFGAEGRLFEFEDAETPSTNGPATGASSPGKTAGLPFLVTCLALVATLSLRRHW
jgi:hypothetical protein